MLRLFGGSNWPARHAACFAVRQASRRATWSRTQPPPARMKPRPGSVPSFSAVPANPPPLRHCGLHAAHQALAARRRLPRRVVDAPWLQSVRPFNIMPELCAMGCAHCPARARIICIMCKWPQGKGIDPPPTQRVAARGASAASRLPLPVLAPRGPSAPKGLPTKRAQLTPVFALPGRAPQNQFCFR